MPEAYLKRVGLWSEKIENIVFQRFKNGVSIKAPQNTQVPENEEFEIEDDVEEDIKAEAKEGIKKNPSNIHLGTLTKSTTLRIKKTKESRSQVASQLGPPDSGHPEWGHW